jgi:hypothetical protein
MGEVVPKSHSMFQVFGLGFGMTLADRHFAGWWSWRREGNGDLVAAVLPLSDYVRARVSDASSERSCC